jgi:hypothetical protein
MMSEREFTERQKCLLEILGDRAWHYKMDLDADPRLGYCEPDRECGEYTGLNRDIRRIRSVAEIESGSRPTAAVRLRRYKDD